MFYKNFTFISKDVIDMYTYMRYVILLDLLGVII